MPHRLLMDPIILATLGGRVADALRAAMLARGVTQAALASVIGLSRSSLNRKLSTGDFSIGELAAACQVLQLEFSEVVSGDSLTSAEARSLAESIEQLTDAERYYVREIVASVVSLRNAAVDQAIASIRPAEKKR